ncbi:hypothetical protein F5Y08DRAFT_4803 [Xylaria arbuscula]|nr:hypothetical protein F5Y08DRAFT_4803 [Xylaria arbuscula]
MKSSRQKKVKGWRGIPLYGRCRWKKPELQVDKLQKRHIFNIEIKAGPPLRANGGIGSLAPLLSRASPPQAGPGPVPARPAQYLAGTCPPPSCLVVALRAATPAVVTPPSGSGCTPTRSKAARSVGHASLRQRLAGRASRLVCTPCVYRIPCYFVLPGQVASQTGQHGLLERHLAAVRKLSQVPQSACLPGTHQTGPLYTALQVPK